MGDSHTLTIIFSGLAAIASFGGSLLFAWLRDDIRNLATAQASEAAKNAKFRTNVYRVHGILEGKGIIGTSEGKWINDSSDNA